MIETDYLIIGCGAVGMAFADALLSESDADIIIVDRHAKPGGHWNDAYPFVTLHQPSQFYGVSSRELSNGEKDETGLNKGLYHLASGDEVSAYFDKVMRQTFLPSGRVQYFPLCDYTGNYQFVSNITGQKYSVKVKKKLIDATYFKTSVPATHAPNFNVDEGVRFIPLNQLVHIKQPPEGFVIIGGGKTGIDACLWLMMNGVAADRITWIVSRDAWLIDRRNTQPSEEFFTTTFGSMAAQVEAIARAKTIPDLFDRLEAAGVLLRIDKNVRPTMFHGATISPLELEQMRLLKHVVRLGRVQSIHLHEIILANGTIPTSPDKIHIDCSASAITNLDVKPIFEEKLITPQTIRPYQPVFSAAVIGYVEANYNDEKLKNKLCQVVQLPNSHLDWIPMTATAMENQFTWSRDKNLKTWIRNNRLDGFGKLVKNVDRNDPIKMAILDRIKNNSMSAITKLHEFMSILQSSDQSVLQRPQMEVKKDYFIKSRLVETPDNMLVLEEGEVLVKIEKFAYTANNITYAVAGETIGYWQFFPPLGENTDAWGVIPVWGFGRVEKSTVTEIPVGDRLFGYFPPAAFVKMRPGKISDARFIDFSAHRAQLPAAYNSYRRVNNEAHYNPAFDRELMLLFPLHLTSFCLWDFMKVNAWYGAEQVIILSASSKTSTGLGYALKMDTNTPQMIGMTSARNAAMVTEMNIYDTVLNYDQVNEIDASIPTIIVDMSGNSKIMELLHIHLGENMKFTSKVGLTHWAENKSRPGINTERSKFFFAPSHMQNRIKEWGAASFYRKVGAFTMQVAAKTKTWLQFKELPGLEALAAIHPAVCTGAVAPNEGLIVVMG